MQPNTKGLKLQQLKVPLYLQRGGEIIVHHNLDKHTHDYEVELDGDVMSCTKAHVSSFLKRGLIKADNTITTQNPNTETTNYKLCTNIF